VKKKSKRKISDGRQGEQSQSDVQMMSPEFYDVIRMQINSEACRVRIIDYEVRLDPDSHKPKSFFKLEIIFRLLKTGEVFQKFLEKLTGN